MPAASLFSLHVKKMNITPELPGERTPLYPIMRRWVHDLDRNTSEKLMKWRMFCAKWSLHVEDYYGKPIHYEGVKFEGSPRLVFWDRFIEPFLENGIVDALNKIYEECISRNLDPGEYLEEMKELLRLWIQKTYIDMSRTDQVLRGKGNPNSVQAVDVSPKISSMYEYLDSHMVAIMHRREKGGANEAKGDIVEIKPNIYGVGLNLNELWRRVKSRFRRGM
jgi:hypothetical protein